MADVQCQSGSSLQAELTCTAQGKAWRSTGTAEPTNKLKSARPGRITVGPTWNVLSMKRTPIWGSLQSFIVNQATERLCAGHLKFFFFSPPRP